MRYVVIYANEKMQEMGQEVESHFETKAEAVAYAEAEGRDYCRIIEEERG